MRLMNARLCLDCEEVHDEQHCPICSSESFAFLTRWVTPSDTATAEPAAARDAAARIRLAGASRSMRIVRSSNPTPAPPKRGRLVAHGALGLALLGVARMIWRAAPEPRAEPKPDAGPRSRTGTL